MGWLYSSAHSRFDEQCTYNAELTHPNLPWRLNFGLNERSIADYRSALEHILLTVVYIFVMAVICCKIRHISFDKSISVRKASVS